MMIADAWKEFSKAVMPSSASLIQRQEMRRAFYAGCWAILQECKRLGDPSISETEGVAILASMEVELVKFYKQLKEGKA